MTDEHPIITEVDPATQAEIEAALGDREREEVLAQYVASAEEGPGVDPALAATRVSTAAFDLVVRHETGGRAFYEQIIKGRPEWPKGASGITIGFGYDLGYVGPAEFARDWAVLPTADRAALAGSIGKHGGNSSVAAMQTLCAATRPALVVAWETAQTVFRASTLPKFAAITWNALPNATNLSADCFGALVSLTFNRGPSFRSEGARYTEMRAIRAAMVAQNFAAIPAQIRAMIRIWVGGPIEAEMTRRRNNEAALFARGLTV